MPIAASRVLRRRCAPPSFLPLPSSISIRYCAGSLPTAWAISSTMLSTAQKVQPGATTLLVARGRTHFANSPTLRRPRAEHAVIARDQLALAVETGLDLLQRQ